MNATPRIALIHGFAVGLTSPVVRRGFGPTVGFRAFESDVADGSAVVFPWGSYRRVPLRQLLNPFFLYQHYLVERAMAFNRTTHEQLRDYLAAAQPEIIVCHSMGCELLREYLQTFALPERVRTVVFIQSNLPWARTIRTTVPILNVYCPWDPTLLVSAITHRELRAGLRPMKQVNVRNIFFPLFRLPNLHTASIRSPRLRAFLRTLLST